MEAIRRITGLEVRYGMAEPRPFDQPSFIADIGLARSLLGWEPAVALDEGVARTADWFRDA